MSPEFCRVEARQCGVPLHDGTDRVRRESFRQHFPAFRHAAENGAFSDTRSIQPSLYMANY
jgi:hypothetical protein